MTHIKLQGSEKQVAWASEIRDQVLGQLTSKEIKEKAMQFVVDGVTEDWEDILKKLASVADAGWWIKLKDEPIMQLILRTYESLDEKVIR